jgi:hypothetical protein
MITRICSKDITYIRMVNKIGKDLSIAVVPNLRYAYPWGYTADRLGVHENNIGNGRKHQNKKKLKKQKQSYEVLVYKERLM